MATATSTAAPALPAGARALALTPNHIARYAAAACGLVALVLFYQPWVQGKLALVGEASLTGAELARGEPAVRVSRAVAAQSRQSASGAPGAAAPAVPVGGTGGLTLPTRVPTAAAGGGAGGFGSSAGIGGTTGTTAPAPTVAAPAPAAPAAQVGGAGGLTLPTRVPTAAAGGASTGFGTSAGVVAQPTAVAAATAAAGPASSAPQPVPQEPDTIPSFPLNFVPLAALGVFAFSLVWERLSDSRDRVFGRAWTLILAYGGTLGLATVLYKIAVAPADNVLIGQGVGGVTAAAPALWGAFAAFLVSAIALTIAWLAPQPPPPDPYWRARRPDAATA